MRNIFLGCLTIFTQLESYYRSFEVNLLTLVQIGSSPVPTVVQNFMPEEGQDCVQAGEIVIEVY